MRIVIRKHQNAIALNPYEYMLNSNKQPVNFDSRKSAMEYLEQRGLDELRGDDGKLKEEILWSKYGIELHEVDRAQLAQLSHEIKNSNEEE